MQALRGLVEKLRSPVLFDTNRPFKQQKYSFTDKRIVYQTFCSAPLMFRNFSSRKSSVYRHASASRLRNCYCLLLSNKISCRNKIYLQPCLRQIVHSNDRELSIKVSIMCHAHFFVFFKEKFCALARIGKPFAKCLLTSLVLTRCLVETLRHPLFFLCSASSDRLRFSRLKQKVTEKAITHCFEQFLLYSET